MFSSVQSPVSEKKLETLTKNFSDLYLMEEEQEKQVMRIEKEPVDEIGVMCTPKKQKVFEKVLVVGTQNVNGFCRKPRQNITAWLSSMEKEDSQSTIGPYWYTRDSCR